QVGGALRGGEQRTQEAVVGHVVGRDRALPAPAGAAQRVQAAVVAGARERVRRHGAARAVLVQVVLREVRPRERARGRAGGALVRVAVGGDRVAHVREGVREPDGGGAGGGGRGRVAHGAILPAPVGPRA